MVGGNSSRVFLGRWLCDVATDFRQARKAPPPLFFSKKKVKKRLGCLALVVYDLRKQTFLVFVCTWGGHMMCCVWRLDIVLWEAWAEAVVLEQSSWA